MTKAHRSLETDVGASSETRAAAGGPYSDNPNAMSGVGAPGVGAPGGRLRSDVDVGTESTAHLLCGPGCECDANGVPIQGGPIQALDSEPIITVRGLSCAYSGELAFQDVDLDVPKGQITALIGPSGCGKTSLLQSLNRLTDLIPGCRVEGQIHLANLDALSKTVDTVALRRRVGMIFQKPNPFPLSIRRNLDLPLREHGMKSKSRRAETVEKVLRDVGLWDEVKIRLDESAAKLSGGQKQRLCIARALALEPKVILFDEPCSALDPLSSGVVEDLIYGLRGRYTVVIVTHNLAQARRIADRVAFFWTRDGIGRLVEQGSVVEVFERPRHELTRGYVEGMRG